MSGVQSLYEKMLQNPKNRVSSSGTLRQPTPFDGHDKVVPSSKNESKKENTDMDDAFFRQVDKRMANKKSSSSTPIFEEASAKKIAKLEARIDELEELVTIMMKQQMKLMKD